MPASYSEVAAIVTKAVRGKLNVLLEGTHGTGKTSLIMGVARELGLRVKYYSTATLDPFVDLVGLPVPATDENGHSTVVYHRPRDIDQAQIVFFDEFNRAQPKVLNTVLEIIQFKTINGDPLPNLHCVVAACNSDSRDYLVTELDPALLDRFHVRIVFAPSLDTPWFRARFGDDLGNSLCDWFFTDLDKELQSMVSPRALEHIGQLIQNGIEPAEALSRDSKLPFRLLKQRVNKISSILDIEDFLAEPEIYAKKVGADMNVAFRFCQLLLQMKPSQMADVRAVILALPRELLARISAECPFVLQKTEAAIRKKLTGEEADLFREIIHNELKEHDNSDSSNSKRERAA